MVIKSPANPSTKFIKLLYGSQNGFLDNIGGGRFDFRVDGTNVLSLTPGGFVGIGTIDPQNPLDVNGRIRSLEVKVVQTLGDLSSIMIINSPLLKKKKVSSNRMAT
jgi:hypothetical protein